MRKPWSRNSLKLTVITAIPEEPNKLVIEAQGTKQPNG